ncbi:ATP-binding cassette domain-containing protein [Microbacterium sp. RD1]|uniref:ATP-binding cassette domain-containing protein n=1 Tax=Microbacterium sp. RD1 TaxID=3457313 RepID=UPI003FA56917
MPEPLLRVDGLRVSFPVPSGRPFRRARFTAVDDVSFDIADGETLALVGESGSGKSTIGNAVLGLAPVSEGSVRFQGRELAGASRRERRATASDLQVVFQNPYGSLNPSLTIEAILTEPLRLHTRLSAAESRREARALLERVGMPADSASRTPHSFSGGQRQRIAIARALAVSPRLIICDEPTSALDVSTQKIVLDLLRRLRDETGVAYLFITHDLAVVREFADRVMVLNRGRIVEQGSPLDICDRPQNPYTQRLVAAAPVPDPILQASRRAARLASRH